MAVETREITPTLVRHNGLSIIGEMIQNDLPTGSSLFLQLQDSLAGCNYSRVSDDLRNLDPAIQYAILSGMCKNSGIPNVRDLVTFWMTLNSPDPKNIEHNRSLKKMEARVDAFTRGILPQVFEYPSYSIDKTRGLLVREDGCEVEGWQQALATVDSDMGKLAFDNSRKDAYLTATAITKMAICGVFNERDVSEMARLAGMAAGWLVISDLARLERYRGPMETLVDIYSTGYLPQGFALPQGFLGRRHLKFSLFDSERRRDYRQI